MTSFFSRQPDVTPSYTLRALAHLLSYPGAELRAVVPELQQVLANEGAVSDQRLLGLNKLLGTLVNQVTTSDQAQPWTYGVGALMRDLAKR